MYVIAQYYVGTNNLYYAESLSVGKCVHMKMTNRIETAKKFKSIEEIQKRLTSKGFQPIAERPIRAAEFIMEV